MANLMKYEVYPENKFSTTLKKKQNFVSWKNLLQNMFQLHLNVTTAGIVTLIIAWNKWLQSSVVEVGRLGKKLGFHRCQFTSHLI